MKSTFIVLFLIFGMVFLFANGQQEGGTTSDAYQNYMSWTKVNSETISGDETGVLGPAHEGSKGFREIYVNDIGKSISFGATDYPYPVGSILVKESFKSDNGVKGKFTGLTIMVKREEGYNPDNGNWEYIQAKTDFSISNQGKIGMCINCHSVASSRDFVFWDSSF